jgi:hypothetical protein
MVSFSCASFLFLDYFDGIVSLLALIFLVCFCLVAGGLIALVCKCLLCLF